MNKPKVGIWAAVFGVIASIMLIAMFPLYYPFVRAFVERLRNADKTSGRGLSLKDKVALSLNYELDKRLGGLGIDLYRLTGGRIAQLWKVNVLILTTRGRKTGKTRTVLLQFFQDGANMVMNRTLQVHAEELSSNEAIAFWPRILHIAPTYERYQRATTRTIPLVRLVPVEGDKKQVKPSDEVVSGREELSLTS